MTPADRYALQVLDVAMGLHGSNTGACDPLRPDEEARLLAWLKARLDTWRDSTGCPWAEFDEAVRALLRVTVSETEHAIAQRRSAFDGTVAVQP